TFVGREMGIRTRVRLVYTAALVAAVVAVIAAGLVHYGGPVHVSKRAWHSFTAPPVQVTTGSLNKRLFTFSSNGRIDLWRAAWHEARAHPWLGGGAGSYEKWWYAHRPGPQNVRDAHSL